MKLFSDSPMGELCRQRVLADPSRLISHAEVLERIAELEPTPITDVYLRHAEQLRAAHLYITGARARGEEPELRS